MLEFRNQSLFWSSKQIKETNANFSPETAMQEQTHFIPNACKLGWKITKGNQSPFYSEDPVLGTFSLSIGLYILQNLSS